MDEFKQESEDEQDDIGDIDKMMALIPDDIASDNSSQIIRKRSMSKYHFYHWHFELERSVKKPLVPTQLLERTPIPESEVSLIHYRMSLAVNKMPVPNSDKTSSVAHSIGIYLRLAISGEILSF